MSGLHVDDALREIGRLQEDKRVLLAALKELEAATMRFGLAMGASPECFLNATAAQFDAIKKARAAISQAEGSQ